MERNERERKMTNSLDLAKGHLDASKDAPGLEMERHLKYSKIYIQIAMAEQMEQMNKNLHNIDDRLVQIIQYMRFYK